MKKQIRKSASITAITTQRRASGKNDTAQASKAVISLAGAASISTAIIRESERATTPIVMEPLIEIEEHASAKTDRVAQFLADIGLADREIARIREAIPVVPFDAELIGRCRAFAAANLHGWDHPTWVALLTELQDAGYAIGADSARGNQAQRFVGTLLETLRLTERDAVGEALEKVA